MTSGLENLVSGRKILFVDGIRADQMSGGQTSTKGILKVLSHSCDFQYMTSSPSGKRLRLVLYAIKIFPAPIFLLIKKIMPNVWCEFFLRLSPMMLVLFLFKYAWYRPSIVIFNHHSTFYLSKFIKSEKIIYIWHDVPCLKRIFSKFGFNRLDRRVCARIEESFTCNRRSQHFVFSFTDQNIMRKIHGVHSSLLPIYLETPCEAKRKVMPHCWLMVGNWYRSENREGAEIFFQECAALIAKNFHNIAKFNLAGFGADHFMKDLIMRRPELKCLRVTVTQSYSDLSIFQDVALLAPILSGAGIKVKTIEAWSFGIPVIGTKQAFSGMPAHLWKKGGLMVESLSDMAALCFGQIEIQQQIAQLEPYKAFTAYQNAING